MFPHYFNTIDIGKILWNISFQLRDISSLYVGISKFTTHRHWCIFCPWDRGMEREVLQSWSMKHLSPLLFRIFFPDLFLRKCNRNWKCFIWPFKSEKRCQYFQVQILIYIQLIQHIGVAISYVKVILAADLRHAGCVYGLGYSIGNPFSLVETFKLNLPNWEYVFTDEAAKIRYICKPYSPGRKFRMIS